MFRHGFSYRHLLLCLIIAPLFAFMFNTVLFASLQAPAGWTELYTNDFTDSSLEGWQSDSNWGLEAIDNNYALKGQHHNWISYGPGAEWTDYLLTFDFQIIEGSFHTNVRNNDTGRYFIGFTQDNVSLNKQFWNPETFFELDHTTAAVFEDRWHTAEIKIDESNIQIAFDGAVVVDFTDMETPIEYGTIAFEALDNSVVYIDNISVTGKPAEVTVPPELPEDWISVFETDFEDGAGESWRLEPGWSIEIDSGGNHVLSGSDHTWAEPIIKANKNYVLKMDIKPIEGNFHLNLRTAERRLSESEMVFTRYMVGIEENSIDLGKQIGAEFYNLASSRTYLKPVSWHNLRIDLNDKLIQIYVDNDLKLEHEESTDPLLFGGFSFETFEDSLIYFDDVIVYGPPPPEELAGYNWIKTGGPSGGLGYDVRIHPLNPRIMFVTDNPSGVNKSLNGGKTWKQKNKGINTRTGASFDGIPNFSLTIDPGNPDIVWAGMQDANGVYKSIDGGETWGSKNKGISGVENVSIRNFGIHPSNSNIVFAGAEITTGELGIEFDKTKGKIFKTEDGGENWRCVWSGDNLARFVLFNYEQPNILYASTGIFDREAYNEKGVGILKSTDGGESWFAINTGIPDRKGNRFPGFLEMHPTDPDILYMASGNNAKGIGGVFRTINGGENWEAMLTGDIFTVVTISPSNPDIIYAGSEGAFYRSDDGGDNWHTFRKPNLHTWGPPGIRPGFPISAVASPNDPMTIFVNNYGGGCFKSTDGGETWQDSSKGYTGAEIHDIAINKNNAAYVLAIGRSGPFKSNDYGVNWSGLAYAPIHEAEWNAVAIHLEHHNIVLISDEFQGSIYKSTDGGLGWECVFRHSKVTDGDPKTCRHGFFDIQFAPSDPAIVYAGMRKGRRAIDGDFPAMASYGMYKSLDGGENWHEINNGLDTQYLNIHCIAVHPDTSDIVYIGTWMDGVFKTTDGGETWKMMNNGLVSADVRSLAINPNNPSILYAGLGEGAGIFKSEDAGCTWHEINNGIDVVCPSSLLPAGKTLVGMSLTPLSNSKPIGQDYYSIPWTAVWDVVVDPKDSSIIYAADHHSGVYVTFDAGKNWSPINNGLSTKAVTEMDISEDGKRIYAGTSGEGVFFLNLNENEAYPPEKDTDSDVPDEEQENESDDTSSDEETNEQEDDTESEDSDGGGGGGGCFINKMLN